MGVLVGLPNDQFLGPRYNWDMSVIGVFSGPSPPPLSVVQYTVSSQWTTRDTITVRRYGKYFCFFCKHPRDVEAMLELHTTVIDGRIITFRRGSRTLVLNHENFDTATLWVRVCGLPVDYLDHEWAVEVLRHVGYVDQVHYDDQGFRDEPEFRAKVRVDLSQPLIPGCYIPLGGNQAAWIYFRYEGVFKFCKRCGVVGHFTCNCMLTEYRASRWIKSRFEGLEANGFRILYGPPDLPFYTNMIEGLTDTFRHRNTRVNLLLLGLNIQPDLYPPGNGYNGDEDDDHRGNGGVVCQGVGGNGATVSSDSEHAYFPASGSLDSSGDSQDYTPLTPDVNVWQSFGMEYITILYPGNQFGLRNDPYALYTSSGMNHPTSGPELVKASCFEVEEPPRANRDYGHKVCSTDEESDYNPVGTSMQQVREAPLIYTTTSVTRQPTSLPSSHPFVGGFTSAGEPTEVTIGTFCMVASAMDDSYSSDSSLSFSFKVIANYHGTADKGKKFGSPRKRVWEGDMGRSHSVNSICSSLDYIPTDWFLKRRKLRIKRIERNGGLGLWKM